MNAVEDLTCTNGSRDGWMIGIEKMSERIALELWMDRGGKQCTDISQREKEGQIRYQYSVL